MRTLSLAGDGGRMPSLKVYVTPGKGVVPTSLYYGALSGGGAKRMCGGDLSSLRSLFHLQNLFLVVHPLCSVRES